MSNVATWSPLQRVDWLLRYLMKQQAMRQLARVELARLAREYVDRYQLRLSPELVGQLLVLLLEEAP